MGSIYFYPVDIWCDRNLQYRDAGAALAPSSQRPGPDMRAALYCTYTDFFKTTLPYEMAGWLEILIAANDARRETDDAKTTIADYYCRDVYSLMVLPIRDNFMRNFRWIRFKWDK